MYAMICTRPDVSYALSVCSGYQSNPGNAHWVAVKNILKYLNRTKNMFLVFGGDEELVVKGYTNSSFMTDPNDFKSQSGYLFTLNGGAVSWKSSKQNTVADSTTEHSTSQLQKLRRRDIGLKSSSLSSVWFLVLKTPWRYTVIIVEPWRKLENQGPTRNPNTLNAVITKSESSLTKDM